MPTEPVASPTPDTSVPDRSGTQVLGEKFDSEDGSSDNAAAPTRELMVPADASASQLAAIGTWLLPVGVALALLVAITGVGTIERLHRRWYRR